MATWFYNVKTLHNLLWGSHHPCGVGLFNETALLESLTFIPKEPTTHASIVIPNKVIRHMNLIETVSFISHCYSSSNKQTIFHVFAEKSMQYL